jgi:short subunit dehydrogenase-like uncharacterized protein
MTNSDDNSNTTPLASPVLTEHRHVPTPSTLTFLATLLATPICAVTVLPLTILYQVGRAALGPLLKKDASSKLLDSGYVVDPARILPQDARKYDIVVLGATGFTGRLAVRHLAKTYGTAGTTVKWAMAGRSQHKLDAVKEELAQELGLDDLHKIDCIVVNTSVPSTLPALVQDTRVVATTAGPYALYGSSVVEFCAKFGTHYVDITGEVDWVKAMATQWNDVARQTGAKLISFCGHDSIPWDLSVMKLQEILQKDCNDQLKTVTFWDEAVGGAPGGTYATVLNAIDGGSVKAPRADFDPFLRLPDGTKSDYIVQAELPMSIARANSPWDTDTTAQQRWSIPFVMASVNAQVVRWSHALRRQGSKSLVYKESAVVPDFKSAYVSFMGLNMVGLALFNPLTRRLVTRLFPAPGQGPSMKAMETRHFLCVYGEGIGENGNRVESIMYLPQDAGCLETSKMLIESGLCMALQEGELPALAAGGGFWTPSTALGDVLMQRLLKVGVQWSTRVVRAETMQAKL